jgi:glycerophosphoryl diester phosphodiesterase
MLAPASYGAQVSSRRWLVRRAPQAAPQVTARRPGTIGHRGAKARVLENSVAGFHWAADRGIQAVECDVRTTADGVLVCLHDPTPARLGGPNVPIADLSSRDVRDIRLAGDHGIPTLDEVLDTLEHRSEVVVEIKNHSHEPGFSASRRTAGLVAELLDTRRRAGHGDAVRAVSSFDHPSVVRFVEDAPNYSDRAALLSPPRSLASRTLQAARDLGIRHIHPHYSAVLGEPWVVSRARRAQIDVTPWTVNHPLVARALFRLGVASIVSDDPLRISSGHELVESAA